MFGYNKYTKFGSRSASFEEKLKSKCLDTTNTPNLDPECASFEEKLKSKCLDTTNTSTAN
jgi:hypothetical protein